MGNKVGTSRPVVDEKYTKPQGLYETPGVDLKRLRKLILAYKLAPCHPGKEDGSLDLEECPICFMNYPSLNRSRCCHKGICTECYLQLQSTCSGHATKPSNQVFSTLVRCPFCKASNLVIEFLGVRTSEEKRMEQIEEQKFIEAVMRKRQQELNDEKQKTMQRQYLSQPSRQIVTTQLDNHDSLQNMLSVTPMRRQEHVQRSGLSPASLSVPGSQSASPFRDDSLDVDFEDIMLEEAIWLSLQEQGAGVIDGSIPNSRTSQLLDRLTFQGYSSVRHLIPSPGNERATYREENESQIDNSLLETGSQYATSNIREQIGASYPAGVDMSSSHLPESFEEQLMLAMVISIAEI